MDMKTAIIIERANIALGGAERSVFELADGLSNLGIEVDILAAKGKTNIKNIHILCEDNSGQRTSHSAFGKALKGHLAENNYDIIHSFLPFDFADVYQPRGGSFAEAIDRNAASYQNRLVQLVKKITAFTNFRRTALLRAERKLSTNPAGPTIAALSEYVARQFKHHYNTADSRIVVIPNGVNTNKEASAFEADSLRNEILSQLGVTEADNPMLIFFAAHNFRLKGLGCLIKSMHAALQKKPDCPLYLIVAGSGKTDKYFSLAKQLGIEKKILFTGPVPNIGSMLSISDIAALPTFYDPASRFILEALAAGKPVITTKFNGAAEIFTNDRHGKVIDRPENIEALTEAVLWFSEKKNLTKAGEAIIADNLKEKISIDRASEKINNLYEMILKKRREK